MQLLQAFLGAFIASFGFAIFFQNQGKYIVLSALGGALAWTTYVYFKPESLALAALLSGVVCAIYAEALARIFKAPATVFLIIAILPMVPGADIFNAMKAAVLSDIPLLQTSTYNTLTIAGYLALGILLVSSLVVLSKNIRKTWQKDESLL